LTCGISNRVERGQRADGGDAAARAEWLVAGDQQEHRILQIISGLHTSRQPPQES
jgi:hypothetical protein